MIIVGNGRPTNRTAGGSSSSATTWYGNGPSDFEPPADCYLKIAGYMSRVFNEKTSATTLAQADDVLDVQQSRARSTELFDLQLLAAWLNFANGAIEWNRLVDTNGDKTADTNVPRRDHRRRDAAPGPGEHTEPTRAVEGDRRDAGHDSRRAVPRDLQAGYPEY